MYSIDCILDIDNKEAEREKENGLSVLFNFYNLFNFIPVKNNQKNKSLLLNNNSFKICNNVINIGNNW